MNSIKPHAKENNHLKQQKTLKNKPTLKDVRQDKRAFPCARTASSQPVTVKNPMRTRRLNTQKPRSQKGDDHKKRSTGATVYFEPIVRKKIEQIVNERGASLNAVATTLFQRNMQEKIIREQIEFIKSVIEYTIARDIQEVYEVLDACTKRLLLKKSMRRKN